VKRRCVLRNISVCRQEGRQAGKRRILINGPPCKGMDKNGPPCKGQPVVLKMVPRARDGPPYTEWSPVQIKMVPRANWSSVPIKVVLVLRARDTHPGRYKLLNMVPGAGGTQGADPPSAMFLTPSSDIYKRYSSEIFRVSEYFSGGPLMSTVFEFLPGTGTVFPTHRL